MLLKYFSSGRETDKHTEEYREYYNISIQKSAETILTYKYEKIFMTVIIKF